MNSTSGKGTAMATLAGNLDLRASGNPSGGKIGGAISILEGAWHRRVEVRPEVPSLWRQDPARAPAPPEASPEWSGAWKVDVGMATVRTPW